MGDGTVAFIFGAGFGAWVYNKLMKTTNRQQSSLIGGGIAGVGSFIVLFTLMKFVLHI